LGSQLDGIIATKQIKANLPNVRVVMLTSHNNETEMIAALASGADACCIKGTSLEQLSVAISAAQQGATYLDPLIARSISNILKLLLLLIILLNFHHGSWKF
jgi:DNA-binding NarL/FixJ family response regulator